MSGKKVEGITATDHIPMPGDEDGDNISDYKFHKYAATYFQGNATHTYIRRALKHSLLPLRNEGDQLVSLINYLLCIYMYSRVFTLSDNIITC